MRHVIKAKVFIPVQRACHDSLSPKACFCVLQHKKWHRQLCEEGKKWAWEKRWSPACFLSNAHLAVIVGFSFDENQDTKMIRHNPPWTVIRKESSHSWLLMAVYLQLIFSLYILTYFDGGCKRKVRGVFNPLGSIYTVHTWCAIKMLMGLWL